ncbi:MAG TPA: DNRLRE domain-containing protein, partial [Microthrixaceae bacterium]|nr:DNRLRE domain-containing protein [Microthrixaceae bacterium]
AASASIYGNLLAGEGTGTRYFRVQAHNSTGWGPFSNPGSTTALRQECTLNATESKWVGQYNGSNTGGSPGGELKVRYRDSKDDKHDYWSYIKFDQRPTGTSCSEFGAPLPATAVPDGRPTGYDTGSVATYAVVIANRTSGPGSGQVAIHQAASTWDEASLTWSTKPARQSGTETDHISGGSNGARWWAVSSDYAVNQRSSNRFGWILGQKDGSDEWKFDGRSASNPPKLRIRFR